MGGIENRNMLFKDILSFAMIMERIRAEDGKK
jgi:hypothetical protein